MNNTVSNKINIIAPVLRILLGQDSRYPLVRFREQAEMPGAKKIAFPEKATEEKIIECLSGIEKSESKICVEGIGVFEILPVQDRQGRVAGKVVIVTGAAQGFGLEIAQDMARQGASVVLADMNEALAQKQADLLRNTWGPDRAMAISINVTELASIQSAIHDVVKFYGGFDVFISNAGVLKAESVKTQSEKDFDFVTAVNYKGYFLCTQAASKILALQHKANPAYLSDIIQINSKSGLVGSNRNAAYAGSKFGGIGLTQSFALELVEDGIKVNSICPGNFFDGPLWSNPDNGLFAQYLRAGKIPGAKTIEDVKRAYEFKVPMGRGCRTQDVMAAVYYLIEQQYETGQAVAVTGGQVMLH
jgi:sorbitol-6-phosphate 2-dehydrogenase